MRRNSIACSMCCISSMVMKTWLKKILSEKRYYPNTDEWRYGELLKEKCEIYEFEVRRLLKKMWDFYYNLKSQEKSYWNGENDALKKDDLWTGMEAWVDEK